MLIAILTILTLVAFAANSLLCRMALGGELIDPVSFTTIRLLSGALVLLPLSRAVGAPTPSPRSASSWASGLALFTYALAFSLAYVSLDTGMGALLLFGAVQVTMIGAALRAGERPHAAEWLGLAAAMAGLVYLISPGISAPPPGGALLMTVAGIAWGVYSLRGRRAGAPMAATSGNFARSVPFAIATSLVTLSLVRIQPAGAVLALVSGAVTSGLGYVIWYRALRGLTATTAAIVQLLVPVLAALGGVVFLTERITHRLVIASVLILGGVAVAARAAAGSPRSGRLR